MGLSNDLSCEAGSLSCCRPNPEGRFQSEVWGFISPSWSPGLHGLLRSPPLVRFIYAQMWGRAVLPALCLPRSPPLWVRPSRFICGQMWGPRVCYCSNCLRHLSHTLPVLVRHSHASPLHSGARLRPSYLSGWMLIFYFLGVGPPCLLILCQFWLCEEVQCVYLRCHLGSPYPKLLIIYRELFCLVWGMYPSPYLERPVGTEVRHTGSIPMKRFSHGESGVQCT